MNYYGISDKGTIRDENQDCCAACKIAENAHLFIVCDGMGGISGGKIASTTVCTEFEAQMRLRLSRFKGDSLPKRAHKDIPRYLEDSLSHANKVLHNMAANDSDHRGMGTTLVALFVIDNKGYVINVGDSRAYFYSGGSFLQITKDHSYVQFLVDSGKISEDEAEHHPQKNVITRSVGVKDNVEPDMFEFEFVDGDCILLCTDGLSGFVDTDRMLRCFEKFNDIEARVKYLVDLAKKNNSSDNITALIVENGKGE